MTTITMPCSCGARVQGEISRFRSRPPCPKCGKRLTGPPEKRDDRKVPFKCLCGLEMKFPWRRGGLWFVCPECGRKSVIPGRGSNRPRELPIDLPPMKVAAGSAPRVRVAALIVLGLLATLAAIGFVLFL